ncbi:MAG: D-2-hydroxyacid dehydrogenase [Clostridia bacterium]|nr:D-2-hydroxyacid dehydrogenase [Clostridia bacterium]
MNLLVTGAFSATERELDAFRALGHSVVFMQDERGELPVEPEWAEGVICNGLFLYHSVEDFVNLRYVQLTSAGYDRVPMDYLTERGARVRNARGVYSIPMAEFALSGVLSLYKRGRFFSDNQRAARWEKHRGLCELYGKNVLIVGCGSVGAECAKRFNAFGTHTRGLDLYPRRDELYEAVAPLSDLVFELSLADIVVLTLPLTEESRHLFDKKAFVAMKRDAVLVNIARGGVVDTEALYEALGDKLFGAVLDVFEEEPLLSDSPLWKFENALITPHNSFVGEGNADRLFKLILENLKGNCSYD